MSDFCGPFDRSDFDSANDYHRYLHESGLPFEMDADFAGISGGGQSSALLAAIVGHDLYEYERSLPSKGRRWTRRLSRDQFERAYKAVAFANCLGKVMDSRMHVSLATVGIKSDHDKLEARRAFMDLLHRWFDRKGCPLMAVWVQERGKRMGLHFHVLLHVPPFLAEALKRDAVSMLEGVVGRPLIRTPAVKTMLVQPRRGNPFLLDYVSQWCAFDYMMKAAKADGGDVPGKRLGFSRNIDEAARKKWLVDNDPPADLVKPSRPTPPMDGRFIEWFRDQSIGDGQ